MVAESYLPPLLIVATILALTTPEVNGPPNPASTPGHGPPRSSDQQHGVARGGYCLTWRSRGFLGFLSPHPAQSQLTIQYTTPTASAQMIASATKLGTRSTLHEHRPPSRCSRAISGPASQRRPYQNKMFTMGRRPVFDKPMTAAERMRHSRQRVTAFSRGQAASDAFEAVGRCAGRLHGMAAQAKVLKVATAAVAVRRQQRPTGKLQPPRRPDPGQRGEPCPRLRPSLPNH